MIEKKNSFRLIFRLFTILFFVFFSFGFSQAKIVFYEIFPNTIDDKNLEYISLKNTANSIINLNNWYLKDKANKKYIFSQDEKIGSFEEKKYFRTKTKIILNNSKEKLYLYNNFGELIDSFSYKTSKKGEKILTNHFVVEQNSGNENNQIDTDFLEEIGNIFENKNIVYKKLENIDCKKYFEEKDFGEILENINTKDKDELIKEYEIKCKQIEDNKQEKNNEKQEKKDLPKMILEFQRPSYILDLDKFRDKKFFDFDDEIEQKEFFCDNKKTECKINFNLEKSFSGSFLEKNFSCEIIFGDEKIEKCNPNTIIFSEEKTGVIFKIFEKNNIDNFIEKKIIIWNKKQIEEEKNLEEKSEGQEKIEEEKNEKSSFQPSIIEEKEEKIIEKNDFEKIILKNPEIIIQSGLTENFECKNEICNINLIYNPKNKREKCIWDFGVGVSKSEENNKKCNPSYVKFEGFGEFEIKLKVYDSLDENNFVEKKIKIKNLKKIEKIKEIEYKKEKNSEKIEENKQDFFKNQEKILEQKQDFYIFLQGSLAKKYIIGRKNRKLKIKTKKDHIKVNFGLKFSNKKRLRKIKYEWRFGNLAVIKKKNPKSFSFPIGRHFIIVRARYNGKIIFQDYVILKIEKIEKIEKLKLKKIKIKKEKKYKKTKKNKILKAKIKIFKDRKIKKISHKKNKKKLNKKNKKLFSLNKKIDFKIILQGKKSKNKFLKNDEIICYSKDICKINLGLEKVGNLRGLKYIWDFDGKKINKKNPKTMDFELGNYKVFLDIFYKNKKIFHKSLKIIVIKQEKKVKKSKKKDAKKKNKKSKNKKSKKTISKKQNNFFIKTVYAGNYNDNDSLGDNFFDSFLYFIISIITMFLVYILLKKEGILQE